MTMESFDTPRHVSMQRFMRRGKMREMRAQAGEAFTLDQVQAFAPAVFAEQAHSSRSERYTFIPTMDVLKPLYADGYRAVSVNVAKVRDDGRQGFQKHLIRLARIEDLTRPQAERQEVVALNAHDGTASWTLFDGIFRMICMNGHISGDVKSMFKVHHKGNVIDDVLEAAHNVTTIGKETMRKVREWKTLELGNDEYRAFAESAALLRFNVDSVAQLPVRIEEVMTPRRLEDTGRDLWTRMNVVQEHIIKGGVNTRSINPQTRQVRRGTARPVQGIDQSVELNRAMWHLAQRMAELKAA